MKPKMYLWLLALLLIVACKEDAAKIKAIKISHSIDSLRTSLGLPPLSKKLELESYGMDAAIWENKKDTFPKLWTKCVFWDSVDIYEERNYFYNSDTERLQVYFIFKKVKGIDTIGICRVYQKNLSDSGIFLLKEQSDSILRKWHL
jgi:hypothetical protein